MSSATSKLNQGERQRPRFPKASFFASIVRKLAEHLRPVDVLCIGFLSFLSLVVLVFCTRIPNSVWIVLLNGVCSILIGLLGPACSRIDRRSLAFVRDWYPLPLIFLIFKEFHLLVPPIHHHRDYDALLIAMDRLIFRTDPTAWLGRFTNPFVTEILQISYALFFVNFIVIGCLLYRRSDRAPFHQFAFLCAYGFFLSYLGYFILPAIGPRFTLHDFGMLEKELPGIWLTPYLRGIMNWGDSIPTGAHAGIAAATTQRDAFPSGHTMMTLVAVIMSYRNRIALRHFLAVSGALLIFGSVYLRYHYVIDLAAGALLAWICLATWPGLYGMLGMKSCPVFEQQERPITR